MLKRWLWLDIFVFLFSLSQNKELKGPPRLYPSNRLVTAEEGDQVKLPCPISANPEPLYEWKKDGRRIDSTWPRYGLRKHFLRIKAARESDTGEFTCTGVNGFGQQTFTYSLLVYGEDLPAEEHQLAAFLSEVSPMSPTNLEIGQSVTLICKAEGVPTPKITWSKDGTSLYRTGIKLEVRLNSAGDEGRYTCSATNPLAIVTHEFWIVMAEQHISREPKIDPATNTTIQEGENTTLQCLVESNRPSEMQWLKLLSDAELRSLPRSNNTLYRDGRVYRYVRTAKSQFENGTSISKLHITRANIYDDGTYICLAATNKGYNYKEILLRVLPSAGQEIVAVENSQESEIPWLFIVIPSTLILILSFSVVLLCRARRASTEKTYPARGTKNISMEPEETDTPVHSHKVVQTKAAFAPDLVFQDGSSYSTNVTNMCPGNGSIRAMDPYQENPYLDPHYADPFMSRFEPSDHSYAFLTQSSTSPLPPPPYVFPPQAYVYAPPSPAPKFVVHCNL